MLERLADGVWLISTRHPPGTRREDARQRIRDHVREVLGKELGLPAQAISVVSQPGSAPRLLLGKMREPGFSISHDNGMSVAAINLHGKVGIDLMHVQEVPDWQAVALDFLGPRITTLLQRIPEDQRPKAFATAWCQQEARLKCHGYKLVEWAWAPVMSERTIELNLPYPLVGAIATV
ncbi:4'-phosphopantetheinyl transferase family protein [Pseudomonas sp. TH15]|uniref:4'-phosphopantetheinyl transferase family protein n=1 Tax=Pseudomonas sp. TH15 TaxID=2796381 RepID=UPI00191157B2|nr:4'-phosphopantetheinyl transferase superfamily protein [Pseudomonas sp. TH15]MBK5513753.1 4'-phosphopantetheinyl transferase superfamily protein [Pseudomonas sp. TH15]